MRLTRQSLRTENAASSAAFVYANTATGSLSDTDPGTAVRGDVEGHANGAITGSASVLWPIPEPATTASTLPTDNPAEMRFDAYQLPIDLQTWTNDFLAFDDGSLDWFACESWDVS